MAHSERFELELPADLAQFVRAQVERGSFASDGDLLREAVRSLQRQEARLTELRAKVSASLGDPRPSLSAEEVTAYLDRLDQSLLVPGDHA